MSGSVNLGSSILSLFGGGAGQSDASNLLSILYPAAGSGSGSANPVAALRNAEANSARDITQTAAQPAVARDIAAFRSAVTVATTPQQLLQNPTVLKVLLTANGLGSQVGFPALAQKALLSDTKSSTALANKLGDPAWKSAASLYDFANQGLAVLNKPGVIDTLVSAYAEVTWRKSLDQTTPGLSEALTFRSAASTITSVDQILGNAIFRKVVTTALNIPQQIAFQPLGTQEQAISSRLDITKFKDPKFVEAFTTRYLLAAQSNGSGASSFGQSGGLFA